MNIILQFALIGFTAGAITSAGVFYRIGKYRGFNTGYDAALDTAAKSAKKYRNWLQRDL